MREFYDSLIELVLSVSVLLRSLETKVDFLFDVLAGNVKDGADGIGNDAMTTDKFS